MFLIGKNILGIIPARAGSKGLKGKNMLCLGGESLIARAVREAKRSKILTRVVFTSDDKKMMNEAKMSGAEVLFERPAKLADDYTSSWSVVIHAVNWLEKNEKWKPDYICLLQPTTPFRTGEHIDIAFDTMFNNNSNSFISVKPTEYPPHWMFTIDENDRPKRLFPEGKKIKRRQDAPVVFQPNGLIYIIQRELLSTDLSLPLTDTSVMKMDHNVSINIDTSAQYEEAKLIFKNKKLY